MIFGKVIYLIEKFLESWNGKDVRKIKSIQIPFNSKLYWRWTNCSDER